MKNKEYILLTIFYIVFFIGVFVVLSIIK